MSPSENLKQGQSAFFSKPPDYTRARDCFLGVITSAPEWVEGHQWLASAFERLGDFGFAIKSYKRAIQCDPKDSRPRVSLGSLLLSTGHQKQAIIELEKGIGLKPRYGEADARILLAEAFLKAGKLPSAREQWRIVAQMEPCYPSDDSPQREARKNLAHYPGR